MNIKEAIDVAMPEGKAITRKKWREEEKMLWVIPTNTSACMVLMSLKEPANHRLVPGWQPEALDLQADDWVTY
ncbi:MW1434 family type I TA system toxin [Enterococcus thailandicus]|uniref:Thoeris anti-defense Tad2 family protein n=1 Tax=Enterococcus thailandicus TaxID=417368 RepID=UPI0039A5AA7D